MRLLKIRGRQIKTAYKESEPLCGERDNLDKRQIMYETDFKIRGLQTKLA